MSDLNRMTINDIKLEFTRASMAEIPALLDKHGNDSRKGVQKLCKQGEKHLEYYYNEIERIKKINKFDRQYLAHGHICGVDEVGRGPLAGPVLACALILPENCNILYINDSKKLSDKKREELYNIIIDKALSYGIGMVSPEDIDELNILRATYQAMRLAVENLSIKPDLILSDGFTIPNVDIKQVPIVKGDSKSMSIGAASIVAKVTRDRMMVAYDKVYPAYNFAQNKGYGTKEHINAIKTQGLTPIHRRSFVQNIV